jgi:hypothetical protein
MKRDSGTGSLKIYIDCTWLVEVAEEKQEGES